MQPRQYAKNASRLVAITKKTRTSFHNIGIVRRKKVRRIRFMMRPIRAAKSLGARSIGLGWMWRRLRMNLLNLASGEKRANLSARRVKSARRKTQKRTETKNPVIRRVSEKKAIRRATCSSTV